MSDTYVSSVIQSRSARGSASLWTMPVHVRDLISLGEWLATLPVPQRDVSVGELQTGDRHWSVFGWNQFVKREDDTPDERDRVKHQASRELAFCLLGFFAASPEGVIWRIRPEMDWQTDPITGSVALAVYSRIGTDPRAREAEERAA